MIYRAHFSLWRLQIPFTFFPSFLSIFSLAILHIWYSTLHTHTDHTSKDNTAIAVVAILVLKPKNKKKYASVYDGGGVPAVRSGERRRFGGGEGGRLHTRAVQAGGDG